MPLTQHADNINLAAISNVKLGDGTPREHAGRSVQVRDVAQIAWLTCKEGTIFPRYGA